MRPKTTAGILAILAIVANAAGCSNEPTVVEQTVPARSSEASTTIIDPLERIGTESTRSAEPSSPLVPQATEGNTEPPNITALQEATGDRRPIRRERPTPWPSTTSKREATGTTGREPASSAPSTAAGPIFGPDDQACLPVEASEEMITDWLAEADQQSKLNALQCMTPDARKRLYFLSPEARWLGEEQLNCIWQGVESIWTSKEKPSIVEGEDIGQLSTEIVRAYCIENKGYASGHPYISDPIVRADLAAMYCLVDSLGGPTEFTAWMVEDPLALSELEEALDGDGDGECGISEPIG